MRILIKYRVTTSESTIPHCQKLLTVFHRFSFSFKHFQVIVVSDISFHAFLSLLNFSTFDDGSMMETHRKSNRSASNGSQFPASTFPETFKDFFSMINEDEDQVELVSNVLEDKVRKRSIKENGDKLISDNVSRSFPDTTFVDAIALRAQNTATTHRFFRQWDSLSAQTPFE